MSNFGCFYLLSLMSEESTHKSVCLCIIILSENKIVCNSHSLFFGKGSALKLNGIFRIFRCYYNGRTFGCRGYYGCGKNKKCHHQKYRNYFFHFVSLILLIIKNCQNEKIKFYIGDALELLPKMDITFDLAFVDGDKRKYIEYYEQVLKMLSPGGYIIADNTLWDGHVLEEPHHTDMQTIGIKKFNDLFFNFSCNSRNSWLRSINFQIKIM